MDRGEQNWARGRGAAGICPPLQWKPPWCPGVGGPTTSQLVIFLADVVCKRQRDTVTPWKQAYDEIIDVPSPSGRQSAILAWDRHGAVPLLKVSAAKYREALYPAADLWFPVSRGKSVAVRAFLLRRGFLREKIQCLTPLYHLDNLCSLFNRAMKQRRTNQTEV